MNKINVAYEKSIDEKFGDNIYEWINEWINECI